MAKVLIVGKTHMKDAICVGGIDLETRRGVRLLSQGDQNQPLDTQFNVGQIWEVIYSAREKVNPPHTEDVIVQTATYVAEQPNLHKFLTQVVRPWYGEADCLFNGLLIIKNKSAYISKFLSIPPTSTGFWIPTKPLNRSNNPKYYSTDVKIKSQPYGDEDWSEELLIPYVGFAPSIPHIPANTLVRVSLARWYKAPGTNNERCYLQLSGWYL